MLLFVVVASLQTAEPNYRQTWYSKSKQPFAGYALHPILKSYGLQSVQSVYAPLQQQEAEEALEGTILLIGNNLNLSEADWQVLQQHLKAGNQVLMAGTQFPQFIKDTLGFQLQNFNTQWASGLSFQETLEREVGLEFSGLSGGPKRPVRVSALAAWHEMAESNTSAAAYPFENLAFNEGGRPVARVYQVGQGQLLVSCTPLLFSNYFLMDKPTLTFTQGLLSWLEPAQEAQHFEFYQVGSLQSQSPLRFFLKTPALKAALILAVLTILLYFIFASKRKQRAIPSLVPITNQSLRFVKTLASLHYRTRNYYGLAQKRWQFFTDFVYRHYRIRLKADDPGAWEELKARSHAPAKVIDQLQSLKSKAGEGMGEGALFTQEKLLNTFYKQTL